MRTLNHLTLCALLVTACVKEHRIVLTLPDAATCAALCVERLRVAITVDGSLVTEESYACNDTLSFDAPTEGSAVTMEVTGVNAMGQAVATALSTGPIGDIQRPRLRALAMASCESVDAQVDRGPTDQGVPHDMGTLDAVSPDAAQPDAALPDAAQPDDPLIDDAVSVFVSAHHGDDAAPGTTRAPVATLAAAIARAQALGRNSIFVSASEEEPWYEADRLEIPIRVVIDGRYGFDGRRWSIADRLARIQAPDGAALTISTEANVWLRRVELGGNATECALLVDATSKLTIEHSVILTTIGFQSGCALRLQAGEVVVSESHILDLALPARQVPPPIFDVRAGRLTVRSSRIRSGKDGQPVFSVWTDGVVHVYGSAINAGSGRCAAIRGGVLHAAHVTCNARHGFRLYRIGGELRLLNSILLAEHPLRLNPDTARVMLKGLLVQLREADPIEQARCMVQQDADTCLAPDLNTLRACESPWCLTATATALGDPLFDDSDQMRPRPPSPAIDAGLDIADDFDGSLEGADFLGTPRPIGPPDLGWLEYQPPG